MKRIILIILIFTLVHSLIFAEGTKDNRDVPEEKSVLLGILLGGLGLTGVIIPGTYGWGNFYAEDMTGFYILNIGGSACTLIMWGSSFYTGNDPAAKQFIPFCIIGSVVFGVASTIDGGLATGRYNKRIRQDSNKAYVSVLPEINSLKLEIAVPF